MTRAEVLRVEISSRQDVLGGKAFGTVGAYEKLSGRVYFAVDPNNPRNKIIADLGKAPRNAAGKILRRELRSRYWGTGKSQVN